MLSGFHKLPDCKMHWETFPNTLVQATWFLEGSTPPLKNWFLPFWRGGKRQVNLHDICFENFHQY